VRKTRRVGIQPQIVDRGPSVAVRRQDRAAQSELELLRLERDITRILLDRGETDATLIAALHRVCDARGWAAAQYWRLDPVTGVLRLHAKWSADQERLRKVMQRAIPTGPGEGIAGDVLRTGAPLWVPDLTEDTRLLAKGLPAQSGWNGALFAPVVDHGCTIGVIEFLGERMLEPDAQLLGFIRALGAQIGGFHARALTLDRLRDSEERYANMVELAAIGISHVDLDGRFVHVNRRLCDMLGYTRDELLQLSVRQVSHPEDILATEKNMQRLSRGEIDSFTAEKRYLRKNGTPIWVHLTVASRRSVDGRRLHDISIIEDITERKEAQSRVQYLATHDEMTGLANRTLFNELIEHAVARERRENGRFAVLYIDLDRFKIINDTLGHEAGDQLLKDMASRLKANVRGSDVLARLGGDEFVLMATQVPDRPTAALIARKLLLLALQPVEIAGQQCRVTASIGIAMFPDDATDATALMKAADMAMYRAKEEGKNGHQFYSADIGAVTEKRLRIETALRNAMLNDELSLHYQAKVDLRGGEIRGVEALLRWSHPEFGALSPAQFIPVAEESGLIVPIGHWVITTACTQAVAWLRQGLPPLRMAVNLSPLQFQEPNLVETLARVLQDTGMPPELLELEITEGVMLQDMEEAAAKLTAISDLGVRLAIDDFGTGYSSLSQLKRFPIDTVKIDRSFIRGIPTDKDDMAITEAILMLGRTLGVTIVAEGVETGEQEAFLTRHSCHQMQGFYFSRPVPPEEFAAFYRSHSVAQPT
jgi:diguanylate cyclase (GGDEF)-like protein/PAS domain S-box-containing protein